MLTTRRVLLFQKRFHDGLVRGDVTLTFRRWPKARVKPGGRYRCHPIGVLEVDALEQVHLVDITPEDARLAGFATRDELVDYLAEAPGGPLTPDTQVYRVALHHAGDGDRVPLALERDLDADARQAVDEALDRLDRRRAWTRTTLELIRESPRVAASQLAARLGRETAPFKADVCKLKRLGLTQSFEVGYELSPRGEAYLAGARAAPRRRERG